MSAIIRAKAGRNIVEPLKENEVYCCENGCGDGTCQVTQVESVIMQKWSKDRSHLIEEHYETDDVSSCCKGKILIRNKDTNTEREARYL